MSKTTKTKALYHQIEQDIKEDIKNLTLKEGQRIMSETEICEQYGVSRITAIRALNNLAEQGYINRVAGKGSYVNFHTLEMHLTKCYSFTEETSARGQIPASETLEGKIVRISETSYCNEIQRTTFWSGEEKVYYIKRLRKVNGKPVAISESFIPMYIFTESEHEKMKKYSYDSINRMIYSKAKSRNKMSKRAMEEIKAVFLGKEDAKLLNITEEIPVLRTVRTTFTDDSVLEYNVFYNVNVSYQYQMEFANIDSSSN